MSKPVNPPSSVIKALKKGDVNVWNEWVKKEKFEGNSILIEGLNLSEIIFTKKPLDEKPLDKKPLNKKSKEDIKSQDFEQIDFSECLIRNCNFSENIMSVNLSNSTIENCNFKKNHFICSTFTGIKFNDNASTFKTNEYVATNINLISIGNCPESLSTDYKRNIIRNIDDCGDLAKYGRHFYRKKEDIETPPLEEFFDKLDKKVKLPKIDLPDFGFGKGAINEFEVSHSIKTFPSLKRYHFPAISWYTPSLSLGLIESSAGSGPKFHVNFVQDYANFSFDDTKKDSNIMAIEVLGIGFGYITKNRNLGFYLGSAFQNYANESPFDVNGKTVNVRYESTEFLRPVISGGFDIETGPLVLTGKFSYDPQKINHEYFDDKNFLTDTQINVSSKTPFLANLGAYLTVHEGWVDGESKNFLDFFMPREIGLGFTIQGEHTVKTEIPSINYSDAQEISKQFLPSITFRWTIDGKGAGWAR